MVLSNSEIVSKARAGFATGKTRPISYRKSQLENLKRFLIECQEEILAALHTDLRKSRHEALLYEVEITLRETIQTLRLIDSYAATEYLPLNLLACLDRGYIKSEPYGVVFVLGPWNYPILLSCGPMIGAIAAGNAVILKPSEISSASSALLAKRLPQYLDPECYFVIEGNAATTVDLLHNNKFDYIFCTGSSSVGKSVLSEAAQYLTPCTLELGGKSPCYIHESSDFQLAAKRILWAKFINLGQTCIAPDYILCSAEGAEKFVSVAKSVLQEWYGDYEKLQSNPDLPRIINEKHFKRLAKLLDNTNGKVRFGGQYDSKDLWIEPTIITNVEVNDILMQEEIFGPILPIINVKSIQDTISTILASNAKPLALYIFTNDETVKESILTQVSSGSVCINDCVWQSGWDGLPFGGVGESGMGHYHGKYSFDTFSHKRAILHRGFSFLSEKLGEARYPPYTQTKLDIFKMIAYNVHHFNINSPRVIAILIGLLVVLIGSFYYKLFC